MNQIPRLLLVMGMPGVGKTTVMRAFVHRLAPPVSAFRFRTVTGQFYPTHRVLVLGDYAPGVFAGTDRWSMGVQQDVPGFWQTLRSLTTQLGEVTVIGEGSRISTRAFIDTALSTAEVSLVFLEADATLLEERRQERSIQRPSWVKGMATRLSRLRREYESVLPTYVLRNQETDDIGYNASFLQSLLVCQEVLP